MGAFAWTTSLLNKVNYFPHYFPHQMAIKLTEKGFLASPGQEKGVFERKKG